MTKRRRIAELERRLEVQDDIIAATTALARRSAELVTRQNELLDQLLTPPQLVTPLHGATSAEDVDDDRG